MIAKPALRGVERQKKQTLPRQLLEGALRCLGIQRRLPLGRWSIGSQQRDTERGADSIGQRGRQEKSLHWWRQVAEDLLHQIVEDVLVAATEARGDPGQRLALGEHECCQPDACGPALGPGHDRTQSRRRGRHAERLGHQGVGLVDAKGQIGHCEPPVMSHQRERWLASAGDDQVQLSWLPGDQVGHGPLDRVVSVADVMVVIQDQADRPACGGELLDQGGDRRRAQLGGLEPLQQCPALGELRQRRLQGGNQVAPEAPGVIIVLIEREPREG